MASSAPRYLIFVEDSQARQEMYDGPLKGLDHDYFLNWIVGTLKPMSDEDYVNGPALILQTLAKSSYVLYKQDVYWLAEWDPGLVAVRMSPEDGIAWTALRSPVPEFGGRRPLPEDELTYDEDAPNPQYTLIFTPWDAQFDAARRKANGFRPSNKYTTCEFDQATAHANEIARKATPSNAEQWREACIQNLEKWAGDGIRPRL